MKVLVAYDSYFGNTEQVARAIASALSSRAEVEARRIVDVRPAELDGKDLIIIGSPTRGFRASERTIKFLSSLGPGSLSGMRVAVFDTRIPEIKMPGFLRLIVKATGYAADKMAAAVAKKGARLVGSPAWFYVLASEGPLQEGELARAAEWAGGLQVG